MARRRSRAVHQEGFYVEGFNEFRRALRADKDLTKALGEAHKRLGNKVIDWAGQQARTRPIGTGAEAISRKAIKSSAKKTSLSVILDGRRWAPVYGAEFGSLAHSQFEPWVGNGSNVVDPDGGYLVARSLHQHRDELEEAFLDEIGRLLEPAFPN